MATPTARNQEDGAQLHAGKKRICGEQLAVSATVMGGRAGGWWIRTMAHIFPQSPLSACLWPSHSPCLLSFPNSLLQMYLGPHGLFISTLTTSLSSTTSHTLIDHLILPASFLCSSRNFSWGQKLKFSYEFSAFWLCSSSKNFCKSFKRRGIELWYLVYWLSPWSQYPRNHHREGDLFSWKKEENFVRKYLSF